MKQDKPQSEFPFPSDNNDNRRRPNITLLGLGAVLCCLSLTAAMVVPTLLRNRAQGLLSACSKSGLYPIGRALSMYAADSDGHYPTELSQLKPKYLKQIPVCAKSGLDYIYLTGKIGRNKDGHLEDYYLLSCIEGHASLDIPAGYPQYDPEFGLIER